MIPTYEVWVGEEIGHKKMFCNFYLVFEDALRALNKQQRSCYEWEVAFLIDGPTLDYTQEGVQMRDRWKAVMAAEQETTS